MGKKYFFINGALEVSGIEWNKDDVDKMRLSLGNFFREEEKANEIALILKAIFRLQKKRLKK